MQRTELQLFHCSFRPAKLGCNFPNAPLIHEAPGYDQALIGRKAVDQLEQHGAALNFIVDADLFQRRRFVFTALPFATYAVPSIRNCVGRNPVEPSDEWNASPFIACDVRQRVMKNFGGQILRFFAIAYTARDVRIHPLEIVLVEFGKTRRIALRCLDRQPLIGCWFNSFQAGSPRSPYSLS